MQDRNDSNTQPPVPVSWLSGKDEKMLAIMLCKQGTDLLLCLSCRIEIWWEVGAGLNNGKKWNNHSKHDFVYLFNIIILVTHPISKHSTLMNKVPINSKNMID